MDRNAGAPRVTQGQICCQGNTRKGDRPGYFLSAEFWADRYRDLAAGDLTTEDVWRKRQAKQALLEASA